LALRGLHSVLRVPVDGISGVVLHHASFRDFLSDPKRSGQFCVSASDQGRSLARSVLIALNDFPLDDRATDLPRYVAHRRLFTFINYPRPTQGSCFNRDQPSC
jgi:hypothetical protein